VPADPPELTVVMPVHNAGPYLDLAIESILKQTFREFRFAIYDDASSDGSYERVCAWSERDARIAMTRGSARLGPRASSQAAAELAASALVARMDADDVAHPERLELGLAALIANPAAILVGSTYELIDGDGRIVRSAESRRILGHSPPFAHASILYRRDAFNAAGGYRAGTDFFEDRDLYQRMAKQGALLVINRPLLGLRHAGQNDRLRHEPLSVVRQIDRHYHALDKPAAPHARVSPIAFYSVAVLQILSLSRPRLLAPMLIHSQVFPLHRYLGVAVLIAVAEVWPRLARSFGFAVMKLRESLARRRLTPGGVYAWPLARPE
jgi:glycosyltransferase involved in cell wall biosynthesis